jgi:uncharacterized protein (TIGR02996 family)
MSPATTTHTPTPNPNQLTTEEANFRAHISANPSDLVARLAYADWLMDRESELREHIAAVAASVQPLNAFGIGVYRDVPPHERKEQIAAGRIRLLNATREFALCRAWLADKNPIRNPHANSYGLKHRVERRFGHYVTNGTFIAAAIHDAFPYRISLSSPNVDFGISKRSLRGGD